MNNYIKLKKSNCKNCYKCIRHCPVKSIKFSDNQANIVNDECILCGECFVACPQNAKEIRNDVDKVKELIKSGKPVYASIAPSFAANFEGANIAMMKAALKALGFADAEETAIGAAIVTREYERMIEDNPNRVIISSCCHTVNTLIQKYYPEAIPMLAPVMSPMMAHSTVLKMLHGDCCTVFIGPCISKKAEAEQYSGITDCVLTFEELSGWFKEESISFEEMAETEPKLRTRLYPTAGGILRSMAKKKGHSYIVVDGIQNCVNALKDVIGGKLSDCFIEMSACSGSCVGGPAMDRSHKALITNRIAVDNYSGDESINCDIIERPALLKAMKPIKRFMPEPAEFEIKQILEKMGKTSPEQELNCGSCGYNTCREKARAVYFGKADLSMCLPYLKEKAESFSDKIISNTPNGIMVLNEELEVQQINAAARKMMNIQNVTDILGSHVVRILDPTPYYDVLANGVNVHGKRGYLAEYGKYIEETILYDKSFHILMSIMRDITTEEEQRSKKESISKNTIEITDKVIEKQMRIVQEIASLLGETTAETKIALTKLKETLSDE